MIINPQFIGSRQTHRKRILHRIDLQEHRGELCIENQRERISHLANNYGPKVYGKLLTLHRRGYGVDVEALCRCQNRRISGRGSRTVRLRLMVTRGGRYNVYLGSGPLQRLEPALVFFEEERVMQQ